MKYCIWPDDTFCAYEDREEYQWKSDDYKVLDFESEEELEEFLCLTNIDCSHPQPPVFGSCPCCGQPIKREKANA